MGREVGVKEFSEHTSKYLREVQTTNEAIIVTLRGKPVAKLSPIDDPEQKRREALAIWAEMDKLAERITASWPEGVSALEAVQEQRREL